MVASIVDVATTRVNETFGATVFGKIVHVGFPVVARRQEAIAVAEAVPADHHAERRQRVEIPFPKGVARPGFVQAFPFALVHVVWRQVSVIANVLCDLVPRGVLVARRIVRGVVDRRRARKHPRLPGKRIDSGNCGERDAQAEHELVERLIPAMSDDMGLP